MKQSLFFSFLLVIFQYANAQNLVVNPSFENTAGCNTIPIINMSVEGFEDLSDWDNANSNTAGDSCSSPDLFSPCNQAIIPGFSFFTGAPDNMLGYQCAKTGDKYVGIITNEMGNLGGNYREYIQGRLTTPMQAGQTYCVSFYVSLADDVTFATNNIGVYFSNTHYLRDACPGSSNSLINVTPQLNYDCSPITNTEWMRLQWDYVATGGEQYLIIGNFFNNANTQIISTGVTSMNPYAYYYIDEVNVSANSCCFSEILPPTPPVTCINSSSPIASFCESDAPVNFNVQMGENCTPSAVTGTWSGTGITNTTTGTFSPSVAGPGTHTISFTNSCGYVATATVVVSPCAMEVCVETNGSLTVSGGAAPYTWQNETTTQDCSACMFGCNLPPNCAVNVLQWTDFATGSNIPAPSGYPIRVIDASGAIVTITNAASLSSCGNDPCETTTISVNVTPTHATCSANGSAVASASGGTSPYTYSWNTTPAQTTANATDLAAGNYTVTATDANGCSGTQSVTINPPAQAPTVTTTSTDEGCGGVLGTATASATGGTAPYSYSWNTTPAQTSATATDLTAGTYTVTVTDANGCSATATATVAPSASVPTVTTTSTDEGCGGVLGTATASATGGTAPYSYSWNTTPAQTSATATDLTAGTYTVTVTDANGCSATATATVAPSASAPTVTTTSTDEGCGGVLGTATASATGGTAPYSYSWNTTPVQTSATATDLTAGTYTVTVTDANGCSATATATVAPSASAPTVTTTSTDEGCGGVLGTATASATGGTAPYSYSWNTTPAQTSATATGLTAGTYTVTVTDANGCSATATATINAAPQGPVVAVSSTDASCGVSSGSATAVVTGGTAPYTYSWNTTPTQTTATASNLGAGTYTVTVTDANGCTSTGTTVVNTSNGPSITVVTSQDVSCFGETDGAASVLATGGTPGYTYTWSPSGGTSANASGLAPGTYTVRVTDNAGCANETQITIGEPAELVVTESVINTNCGVEDGEISLTVTGGNGNYQYTWTPNVSTSDVATGLGVGTYSVVVTDSLGCSASVSATIVTATTFGLDAYPDVTTIDVGESVDLNIEVEPGIVVTSVSWTPSTGLNCTDCEAPTASPTETTVYYVTVIDENGCMATDSVIVVVNFPCGELFVPTIFSPNGDGLNDLECVMGSCVTSIDFTIFDRWGEVVFATKDKNECWDGMFRDKPAQTGVYVYKLKATLVSGEIVNQSGNINLTR